MKTKKVKNHKATKPGTIEPKAPDTFENDPGIEESLQLKEIKPPPGQTVASETPKPQPASQMGRMQQYWIATMLVFADVAVQKNPEGVFDVLARNFDSTGALSWWLHRIGHGEIAKYTQGKDIVDAIRKVAHELYRDLRGIGKPVARW